MTGAQLCLPPSEPATAPTLCHRLVSGGGWTLLGRVAVGLAGLATSVLLTRLLPPADVGTYLLALSVVSVGGLLAGLGLNQVVVRLVAQRTGTNRPGDAWRAVTRMGRLSMLGALSVAAAYLLVGEVLARKVFHAGALSDLTVLLSAWILVVALGNYLTEAHRGYADLRCAALLGGPLPAVLLVGSLAAALAAGEPLSVRGVVVAAILSTGAAALVSALVLRRRRMPRPPMPADADLSTRALARTAGPLLLTSALIVVFTSADLWVVAALLPESEVAEYGTAGRLAGLVGLPLYVANSVLAPTIADLYARGQLSQLQQALRRVAAVVLVPSLALTVLFLAAGSPLLRALYGPGYVDGAPVLAVLALGHCAAVGAGSCGLVLAMCGRQVALVAVTATTGAATLAALVPMTSVLGTTGAAITAAAGLALQNLLLLLVVRSSTSLLTHAAPAELPALARQLVASLRGGLRRGRAVRAGGRGV